MKKVTIEWKHLDMDGRTCDRCAETGAGIVGMVQLLADECRPQGMEIVFRETRLSENEIPLSNLILINGTPLEEILPQANASQNNCCSCGDLLGRETLCRTLVHQGQVYEAVPPQLIREAVCRVAGCC